MINKIVFILLFTPCIFLGQQEKLLVSPAKNHPAKPVTAEIIKTTLNNNNLIN